MHHRVILIFITFEPLDPTIWLSACWESGCQRKSGFSFWLDFAFYSPCKLEAMSILLCLPFPSSLPQHLIAFSLYLTISHSASYQLFISMKEMQIQIKVLNKALSPRGRRELWRQSLEENVRNENSLPLLPDACCCCCYSLARHISCPEHYYCWGIWQMSYRVVDDRSRWNLHEVTNLFRHLHLHVIISDTHCISMHSSY